MKVVTKYTVFSRGVGNLVARLMQHVLSVDCDLCEGLTNFKFIIVYSMHYMFILFHIWHTRFTTAYSNISNLELFVNDW